MRRTSGHTAMILCGATGEGGDELRPGFQSRFLVLLMLLALWPAPVHAEKATPLLEVDLKTGKKKRIDQGAAKTASDLELDALLDKTTGGPSFSTQDLERIEKALRKYLAASRPRAMPRLLLFLYPGRITKNTLKELREVKVDVELLVDPCSRSVCMDSVAQSIELLGRSIKQPTLRTKGYTIHFNVVAIRTATTMHDENYDVFRFQAGEVVSAGQKSQGGTQLMSRLVSAKNNYDREVTQDIARQVRQRRVQLTKPPTVQREHQTVEVAMAIQSDRVRYRSHVLAAFAGAAQALRRHPLTPPTSSLQVVATIPMRRAERRTFSCPGQSMYLLLDGKMGQEEIWSTYVVERSKQGTRLAFDDDEAAGRSSSPVDDEPDRTGEILSAHFNTLAPCLSAEAGRSRSFHGVTLTFAVSAQGKAIQFNLKEKRSSAALKSCLKKALSRIRFQRHGGAPRQVEYPMYIKR